MDKFRFTKHCLERMKSRNINMDDIDQIISMGVKRPIPGDDCFQYDYSDLRLIITPDNLLVTIFRLDNRYLFPRKDTKQFSDLYHRRLASLRERESLAEIRAAI